MSKQKVTQTKSSLKKEAQQSTTFDLIPQKFQTPVFLGVILLLIIIFFNAGIFGGKTFASADNIASRSFETFVNDAKAKGEFPLWTPYIFGGMPSFAALIAYPERMYDISNAIWVTVRGGLYAIFSDNSVWQIVLLYIIFAFGFYFYGLYKFKDKLIALYCGLASVFITPIIQLIIVGHNTKVIAVMMFPWILLMVERLYDLFESGSLKENLFKVILNFSVLVFLIHVQMSSNHIQMQFYFYMLIGLYLLYRLIHSLIKKEKTAPALKIFAVFILAAGFSAMMFADSYLSVKEYNKYSIRGATAITKTLPENQNSKDSEPLDYEYATNWSFSPTEVMTFFIPYWTGFGDVEVKGQRTNTYWGQMPFTTSPMYFGIITILLAFIGIYYNFRKNILVQSLTIISFIALIVSFGRTFPVLYNIMFYNLPFFSSFRAPVMIHIIINVAFVILAGIGIKTIIELAKDKAASGKFVNSAKFIYPLLALPIIFSIIGFESFYTSSVQSSPLIQKLQQQGANQQQITQYVAQIASIAYSNVKSEMLLVGVLLLAAFSLCYFYLKGSLKYSFMILGLIALCVFDLWHIGFKTLHWDNKTESDAVFKTPDYVDWILKNEKNLNEFRVLELNSGGAVRGNNFAFWRIQSLYGYQGAKLRIYQDMDDVVSQVNPTYWKIASLKYLIMDKPVEDSSLSVVFKGSKNIILNKDYKPKAFFVGGYKVANGMDILNNIKNNSFDPTKIAYLEKEPSQKIDAADSTCKATLTNYELHNISFDVEAKGNNLLHVSEVYYPAGWKAYVDGQETEIYKTNYLFRSIVVPAGKHKVEFKFEPKSYYTGKTILVGANVVLLILFACSLGVVMMKRKKKPNQAEHVPA